MNLRNIKKRKSSKLKVFIKISLGLLLVAYTYLCISIFKTSNSENLITLKSLTKKNSPNLVVIFTGDTGRINIGLEKALHYRTEKVLITGVYKKNNLKTVLHGLEEKTANKILQTPNLIEIDYVAKNTFENVLSTLRFLKKKTIYKNVLIVSSDYHIKRIKLLIEKLKSHKENVTFFYFGTNSNYFQWRANKILFKEVLKTIKTYLVLSLWDEEV